MSSELRLIDFGLLENVMDVKAFKKRLRYHVMQATKRNGLHAKRAIQESIGRGEYLANAQFTIELKGSSHPLVDTGELYKSIVKRAYAWNIARVGVLRSAPKSKSSGKESASGTKGKTQDIINVAMMLHEGRRIAVTPDMRRFFWAMSRKDPRWHPLKKETTYIYIPPRPFLNAVVKTQMLAKYEEEWSQAVQWALEGRDK